MSFHNSSPRAASSPIEQDHRTRDFNDPSAVGPQNPPDDSMTDASQQHDQEQLPALTNTLGDGYVILEQEKQNILDQVRNSAFPALAHSHCKKPLVRG